MHSPSPPGRRCRPGPSCHDPQHRTVASVLRTHVVAVPVITSDTEVMIWVSEVRWVVVPSPSWNSVFFPQHHNEFDGEV